MKKFLLPALALAAAFTVNAQDQEAKPSLPGEVNPAVSSLRLASELVKYGYAQQSALPLIDALQIISENPVGDLDATKEGETEVVSLEGKNGTVTIDFAEILGKAREYAADDANLLAIIDVIEKDSKGAHRGRVGGATRKYDVVKANTTDVYTIKFYGDRLAEIGVSGDGDTDLDLYVYDSNGNLIESDTDYSDDCYVSWVPRWTGNFKVKIVNRGRVANRYLLLTN
ncbi:MAG: hypothetical protein HDR80_00590 [Bacteroides sp.]|nr:hypothetical protein [Bacteroides sp.]